VTEPVPPPRAANIFDVARLAGVSHQTVSRVVNDLPNVRPATRERVEQAIRQLRYIPSPAARALVTRRSRTLGLIVTGLPAYGPAMISLGFHAAAHDARYAVAMSSVLDTDEASIRVAAETLVRQNVEAIVVVASRRDATRRLAELDLGIPVVAIASHRVDGLRRVSVDQYQGARAATDHLLDLGHRDIRMIAGPLDSGDANDRVRGWRDALAERGLASAEPVVGDWTPHGGYQAGLALAGSGCTAIIASNDDMALGLIRALAERGLRVPDDVSVVGFDDVPGSAYYAPPLTTIRQDFDSLGRDALVTVLAVLRDEKEFDPVRRMPVLVVRASTAPPPAGTAR
jgi:DNA-binding LacI/PurR family transcriptional regulator